jgi:peptidoglycan hydrolase CwlO-like protein
MKKNMLIIALAIMCCISVWVNFIQAAKISDLENQNDMMRMEIKNINSQVSQALTELKSLNSTLK